VKLPEPASVQKCRGPDGGNLLGFLSALGALITLSDALPDRDVRLGWTRRLAWRPILRVYPPCEPDELIGALQRELGRHVDAPEFARLGRDLPVKAEAFRAFAQEARDLVLAGKRRTAEFAAAYGSESITTGADIADTAFRTMSGAGHQHFLKEMRRLVEVTGEDHLREALFEPWRYGDTGPSMRWDPVDDRRYALRPDNPATSRRFPIRTVRGANRLAVEGLRFFPAVPLGRALVTVGFGAPGSDAERRLRWPIWEGFISCSPVKSLLTHPDLWGSPLLRDRLRLIGVREVFECRRLTEGRFRNFSVARPLLASAPP
jgi:hypothetical protein